MACNDKFYDSRKLSFATFTLAAWVDVFTRPEYREIIYSSIRYCQAQKWLRDSQLLDHGQSFAFNYRRRDK